MKFYVVMYLCAAALLMYAVLIGLAGMDVNRLDISDAASALTISILCLFLFDKVPA